MQTGSSLIVEELPDEQSQGHLPPRARRSREQPVIELPEDQGQCSHCRRPAVHLAPAHARHDTLPAYSSDERHSLSSRPRGVLIPSVRAVERRRPHHSASVSEPDQMHFSSHSISFSTGPGGSRASASRTRLAPGGVAEHQRRSYDGRTDQHKALHQQAVNGRVRLLNVCHGGTGWCGWPGGCALPAGASVQLPARCAWAAALWARVSAWVDMPAPAHDDAPETQSGLRKLGRS